MAKWLTTANDAAIGFLVVTIFGVVAWIHQLLTKAIFEKLFDEKVKSLKTEVEQLKEEIHQLKLDKELKQRLAEAIKEYHNQKI
jgi:regulator of replication initiation timing